MWKKKTTDKVNYNSANHQEATFDGFFLNHILRK